MSKSFKELEEDLRKNQQDLVASRRKLENLRAKVAENSGEKLSEGGKAARRSH